MVVLQYSVFMEDRVVQGFLTHWRDPNEIAFQLEDDTTPEDVEEVLEENNLQPSNKRQRQEYARHIQSFQEPDYLADVDIDGRYVAEDEVPALEDYVDMLTLEMNSEQITETINTLFDEEVVTENEVNGYLRQRDNTEEHGEGNFYIQPETEDERIRLYGLKQVLKEYHEDFDQTVQRVRPGEQTIER